MVSIEMGREISDNRFRKYIHTHSHFPLRKKNEARGKNPLPLPINLSPSLKFCIGPVMKLDSMAKESSHYQSSVLRARPNFLSKSLFFLLLLFLLFEFDHERVCCVCDSGEEYRGMPPHSVCPYPKEHSCVSCLT